MNIHYAALRRLVISALALFFALPVTTYAEDKATCDMELTRKDMNAMIERDVHERLVFVGSLKEAETKKGGKLTFQEALPLTENMQKADKLNQQELDRIVAACGWPTKSGLGAEPVRIAAMIMVHAPTEFTHKYMTQMMASYQAGETFPLWMATVIDDDLIAQGKPQRYGTRGSMNSDGPPDAVEDPGHLQERRRAFGIPPVVTSAE